jgi:peptidoglycan glycosyltransferase
MNTITTSIRKLTNLFVILFILLSGGLVYWQVVVAQQVTTNPHNNRHCLPDSAPIRGRILDRNGVVLAYSKKVDPNAPNANIVCGYQRFYTEPSLAGLIGYYISPLYGSSGIEHEFDNYLSGYSGLTGLNNTINQTLHRPPVGDDIYLTIDVRIQRIVNHLFDADAPPPDYHFVFPTNRGSVVVADPHTGEILAMLSRPGFDPNRVTAGDLKYFHQLETDPGQPLLERPLQARYVPGSSYKTMTLLAALDSQSAQLSDQFDKQHALGPVRVGDETFGPVGNNIEHFTNHYPVDLRYGYAHSDNIIFAQVGAKVGIDTWLKYNTLFYVGQKIPFDLPVAVSTVTPSNGKPLTVAGLAENSFGQGVDFITPLQESLMDNAIANDGKLMRPMLVMRIVEPKGVDPNQTGVPSPIPMDSTQTVVQSYDPQQLNQPISADTASQVRDAMYGVVRCGSTSFIPKMFNSPWSIIAKTGTGEVGGNKPPQSWLLTQAPYHNPQLTIVAMKENGGEASFVDGPMVGDMYNEILANVLKIALPPPPDPQFPYCSTTGLIQ